MNRRLGLGLLLLLATIALWFAARPRPVPPGERIEPVKSAASPIPSALPPSAPAPANSTQPPTAAEADLPAAAPGSPASPGAPTAPAASLPGSVETDLDNVQFTIRDFRTALRENPVGNNAEITSALLGRNLKQVKFPLPPGSRVNADGELIDRWGTPYFFHQMSRNKMEVRSAGPDRVMWTGDDSQQ